MGGRRVYACALGAVAAFSVTGCEYVRLLRPRVLKQLNPRVVRLVNALPDVDHQNEAIIGRLLAHGGLGKARLGADGVMRIQVRAPHDQFIWEPAIIDMPRGGELEITFENDDRHAHAAFLPSNGGRMMLTLPEKRAGVARLTLDQPGYYFFGCPIQNHAGRGMLGLILVRGEVPAEAKLDRPRQPRPEP